MSPGDSGKRLVLWMLLIVLGGCATPEVKVSCDAKLQPINAPNAKVIVPPEGGRPAAVAPVSGDKKS